MTSKKSHTRYLWMILRIFFIFYITLVMIPITIAAYKHDRGTTLKMKACSQQMELLIYGKKTNVDNETINIIEEESKRLFLERDMYIDIANKLDYLSIFKFILCVSKNLNTALN